MRPLLRRLASEAGGSTHRIFASSAKWSPGSTDSCWPRTISRRLRAAGVMIGVTFSPSPYLTNRSGIKHTSALKSHKHDLFLCQNHHLLPSLVTIINQVVVTSSNINHVSHSRHVHDYYPGYYWLVQHHPIITHRPVTITRVQRARILLRGKWSSSIWLILLVIRNRVRAPSRVSQNCDLVLPPPVSIFNSPYPMEAFPNYVLFHHASSLHTCW